MMKHKMMIVAMVMGLVSVGLADGGGLTRAPIARPPQTASVGTTSTMILPPVQANYTTNEWYTPNTNAYGDYLAVFTNGTRWFFWCVTAGTNGIVEPTWSPTNDVTDGAAEWRYINPVRNAYDIRNWGSGKAAFSLGAYPAVINSGQTIPGSGNGAIQAGYNGRPCYQGQINAISESGFTNTLSIHEE